MGKISVLYAEDEKFLGQIVKESLESRGFEVHMEANGMAVMEAFKKIQPDICVLDIMLPGKDGFTLAKEIRQADPVVPILFLSAKTQTEDVVQGFKIGANDYIRKPFSLEELIVRIENALRVPAASAKMFEEDECKLGDFLLNTRNQVLTWSGGERKLSYRECALLSMLYRNRGQILDRKIILQTLWNDDSYFNSRNLDVYITRLRGYLKTDPRIEIITVKGQGYRFILP